MTIIDSIDKIKKKYQYIFYIGIGLIILAIILFFLRTLITIPILLLGLVLVFVAPIMFSRYVSTIKKDIINSLAEKHFDNITYYPEKGLSYEDIADSDLLKKPDRMTADDYFTGSFNDIGFETSDLNLKEITIRPTGKGATIEYVTYFLGRFFIFDFNRSFDGRVLVLETRKQTMFSKYQPIKTESIEFNKVFNTYTTNPHDAFYILTPHFMENLITLEKQNPGNLYLSFIGNKLYLGIHNSKDTFTIKLFSRSSDLIIKEFEQDLRVIKNIIMSLKLDSYVKKGE